MMTSIEKLLLEAGLDRSQRQFCKVPADKNVRLLAPAGSGKTFSLLWRCRAIAEYCKAKGDIPPHFLILTFTRTARGELESRIAENPEFSSLHATVRTLNSWGWEQIRGNGSEIYTEKNYSGLCKHDLKPLLEKYDLIKSKVGAGRNSKANASILMTAVDFYKAMGFTHKMTKTAYKKQVKFLDSIGLSNLLRDHYEQIWKLYGVTEEDEITKEKTIYDFFGFWKKAVVQLRAVNRYSLEDQKYWPRILLDEQIEKGARAPQGITRYTHVIIDEFQDINPLDAALIQEICRYHGQKKPIALTIVGDDDQAIFGWRGTTPKYILYPDKFFSMSFVTCVLNKNYRAPANIIEKSSNLISYNRERVSKEIVPVSKRTARIDAIRCQSTIDSTMRLIKTLLKRSNCQKLALIGRKQVSLFPFQVLLSAAGKKYIVAADIDIYEGEAMNSLQSIIQIVYRSRQDDVNDPSEAVLKICDKIDRYQLSSTERNEVYRYLDHERPETIMEALDVLECYENPIKKRPPEEISHTVRKLLNAETVYEFMRQVEHSLSGLDKDYTKKDIDNHYKEPQFYRLTEIARKYGKDFRAFYRDIDHARKSSEQQRSLRSLPEVEEYREQQDTSIYLLTATRAKGMEFDAVIILDADDHEWPNSLSSDMEEERRLFYVAMTRAKNYLYLVLSQDRQESRFLPEAGIRSRVSR